ncbi:NAD(P)/FAD-dependent oxidoreductase [Ruminococcus sp. OA3]|uniref:NAD(P)/FAD-dependent oxidoreductase n=1 Tax=Ruminococcus sp. OA3 TaxID=2914164 RepID=UPI001F06434E|nr:NAD(P)/FAD-dependent oxidoreductase [Ruminococcus sp. OA3]MCH1983595.1 NAD(P)/FAD-dependent oxidoreductase [Ruminococcus sp. OA3]
MSKVLIIGGGAAGMAAAVFAAEAGHLVHLFEKNEKLGKKVYITGKGRCNFTNACSMEELFDSVIRNPKFLYSAFYGYNNFDAIEFFERLGVRTKIERGNRAFPVSDHASDIILGMERRMKELDVKIHLRSSVKKVLTDEKGAAGILLENDAVIAGDAVLVATGGLSYPTTGSTGDGYRFARECGHAVTGLRPSLVPMETDEDYIARMQGLSLRNVTLRMYADGKCCFEDFGEMLFTHFGITGPLVLTASARTGEYLQQGSLSCEIDWKPALSEEQLDDRILRDFTKNQNKQFKTVAQGLLPSKAMSVLLELWGSSPEKKIHEISREERLTFVKLLKHFPFTVTGLRGYNEAVVTTGGVAVKEINPKTMESKKVKGLYFIGEVLDTDALTGGFNLQIAWSTAYAAASAVI